MAAPSGGGGGGSLVGFSNSFTGTAQALELIGDHCYAYSGLLTIDNTEATMLEFTTGNYYSVVKVQFNYPDTDTGDDFKYTTYLADTVVQSMTVDYGKINYPKEFYIIIPAYTPVKCTAQNMSTSTGRIQIVAITGRIYR